MMKYRDSLVGNGSLAPFAVASGITSIPWRLSVESCSLLSVVETGQAVAAAQSVPDEDLKEERLIDEAGASNSPTAGVFEVMEPASQ